MIQKIIKFISSHKIIAALVLLALAYGGYWGYQKMTDTSGQATYLLAQIKKGTIAVSVSGSGQVSVSNQVDVKAKASGDVVYVGAKNGDTVRAGAILLQLDARDAQKSVRDAELNLEKANIALDKMKGVEFGGETLRSSKAKAMDDLTKAYGDGFNTTSNAFLDLPTIISGVSDVLLTSTIIASQWNMNYYADAAQVYDANAPRYRDDAYNAYQAARKSYDQAFADYKAASRFSSDEAVDKLIDETYETTKLIAEAVKSANNLIQFYRDKLIAHNISPNSASQTHLTTLNTYTDKTNSHLVSLLSIKNTIRTDKEAIAGAGLDLKSQELQVKATENSLLDAKEKLSDYFVRAPSDGIAAKIDFKKGDAVSSGAVAATFITKQRLAEISFNEVDVAKIRVGQKATLTFDAVPELSISGEVAEIDAIGTVAQGVVSYAVKITFDTQDERIKPGMSVSAAVITDVKTDALMAPVSAVKSQGQAQYAETKNDANAPVRVPVTTGIASDEFIEIISGLKEGDNVVSGTISAQTTSAPTQQQSGGLRIPGLTRQGGRR